MVLSIIFGILKGIGILFLVLLFLVLAAILAVLFVPVRYRISGEGAYEQEPGRGLFYEGKARVSWLMRIVTIRAAVKDGRAGVQVRILGIRVFGTGIWEKKKKPGRSRGKTVSNEKASAEENTEAFLSAQSIEKKADKRHYEEQSLQDGIGAEQEVTRQNSQSETEPGRSEQNVMSKKPEMQNVRPVAEKDETARAEQKIPEKQKKRKRKQKRKCGKLWRIWKSIKEFPGKVIAGIRSLLEKILGFFKNIRGKLKMIAQNLDLIRTFFEAEENKAVLEQLKEKVKKLLHHILPGKRTGSITFGLEDPAATGKVLMGLSMIYPFLGEGIQVTPVFENRTMAAGSLFLKGRIRLIVPLWTAGSVWFDKGFRRFLKRGKNLLGTISSSGQKAA